MTNSACDGCYAQYYEGNYACEGCEYNTDGEDEMTKLQTLKEYLQSKGIYYSEDEAIHCELAKNITIYYPENNRAITTKTKRVVFHESYCFIDDNLYGWEIMAMRENSDVRLWIVAGVGTFFELEAEKLKKVLDKEEQGTILIM